MHFSCHTSKNAVLVSVSLKIMYRICYSNPNGRYVCCNSYQELTSRKYVNKIIHTERTAFIIKICYIEQPPFISLLFPTFSTMTQWIPFEKKSESVICIVSGQLTPRTERWWSVMDDDIVTHKTWSIHMMVHYLRGYWIRNLVRHSWNNRSFMFLALQKCTLSFLYVIAQYPHGVAFLTDILQYSNVMWKDSSVKQVTAL